MAVKNRQRQDAFIRKYLSLILQQDLAKENCGMVTISQLEVSPNGSRAWVTL